jgi:hypothetical protein
MPVVRAIGSSRAVLAGVVALCVLPFAVGAIAADSDNVNVSRLPELQTGATIAIDPSNGDTLLAGSNSIEEGTMRIYSSTDAGRTWTTARAHPPPAKALGSCSSDPGVAIDSKGRQYYSFVRATPCQDGARQYVYVVVRAGPLDAWSKPIRVASLGRARLDDKPSINVDTSPTSPHRGRVYLAWTRIARNVVFSIVLSHSDNGGRTWSKPIKVNKEGRVLTYASVAVGPAGTVYVAWDDVDEFGIWMARSANGGKTFRDHRKVASFVAVTIPHCGSGIVIPAQPRTCVNANPIVSVDTSRGRYSGRVYVSYARTEFRGRQAAHIALFDPRLRRIAPDPETREGRPVAPTSAARQADQFWPQSAVDASDGTVWMCFYDTLGDPARKRAFYSCTISRDGGRTWRPPVRAATVASDETQPGALGHYGYQQGVTAAGGVAHPIWTDTRELADLSEEIYTTSLRDADFG